MAASAKKSKKAHGPCFLEPIPTKETANERYFKHKKNGQPVLDEEGMPICVNWAASYK